MSPESKGGTAPPPQLASNIESFDNGLRLLIAVAARAAANSQLPQDAHLQTTDIASLTEDLSAFALSDEKPGAAGAIAGVQPPVSGAVSGALESRSPSNAKAIEGRPTQELQEGATDEIDALELQESNKAIKEITDSGAQKLDAEQLRAEREKIKVSVQKVEDANAGLAKERKKRARDWADAVAKHCKFGEYYAKRIDDEQPGLGASLKCRSRRNASSSANTIS